MLPEAQHVGHKISTSGLELAVKKVKAIKEALTTKNMTQLKYFSEQILITTDLYKFYKTLLTSYSHCKSCYSTIENGPRDQNK